MNWIGTWRLPSIGLALLFLLSCTGGVQWATAQEADESLTLYVAPGGDDHAAGDVDHPLATLEAARDRIRQASDQGRLENETTVYVRGGVYPRRATLRFQQEDSGRPEAPVIYRAYEGESPRVIGGRRITGFHPVGDSAIRDRLPEEARNQVRVVNLRDQGVADFGKLSPRGFGGSGQGALELFFDGRPMTLARWPNQGWMTIDSLPGGQHGRRLGYTGDRPARWGNAEDPWLFGYWYHGWADQYRSATGSNATCSSGWKNGATCREPGKNGSGSVTTSRTWTCPPTTRPSP